MTELRVIWYDQIYAKSLGHQLTGSMSEIAVYIKYQLSLRSIRSKFSLPQAVVSLLPRAGESSGPLVNGFVSPRRSSLIPRHPRMSKEKSNGPDKDLEPCLERK
jgi:hypothetical protein